MKLLATLPGETVESVQENTGFELLVEDNVYQFAAPTSEELRLITKRSPQGYFIKRK